MALNLENLEDPKIRDLMLDEFESDLRQEKLYIGKTLKEESRTKYPDLLRKAIKKGNDETLSKEMDLNSLFKDKMFRKGPNGMILVKVPWNASLMLAEGEFNRFYIRAICLKAIRDGKKLEIYRAKQVRNPRPESESKIGQSPDAQRLLNDLRTHLGVDTALGIPSGPNSGLSVRFKIENSK